MTDRKGVSTPTKAGRLGLLPLAVVTLCFVLTWDTQPPPHTLIEFLLRSSSDCTTPCWQGIRPGVTTRQKFDSVLAADPERFAQLTLHDPKGWARYIWVDASGPFTITVMLEFQGGVASQIHFCPADRLAFVKGPIGMVDSIGDHDYDEASDSNLATLDDIVDVLGPPDKYTARVFWYHTGVRSTLNLVYEDERVVVEGPAGEYLGRYWPNCGASITPDLPVVTLLFHDPKREWQPPYYHQEIWPWSGFGKIDVFCMIE